MPDLILPLKTAVAAVLAAAHALLSAAGLDPGAGGTWAAAIALLVLLVRLALLPAVAHGVRQARAAALARPQLLQLCERYAAQQRAVRAEHGLSPLGCLPALLQLPVAFALYAVLADVAAGRPVGAMDAALVASAGSASIAGARLADRLGGLAAAPGQLAVAVGLAVASALLSYATQRWFVLPNVALDGLPEAMAGAQRLMPAVSAVGLLASAAVVPVGLLLYWVAGNACTLAQQALITRYWPTPGTPAHEALLARRPGRPRTTR